VTKNRVFRCTAIDECFSKQVKGTLYQKGLGWKNNFRIIADAGVRTFPCWYLDKGRGETESIFEVIAG
jgi:hypothetical protein